MDDILTHQSGQMIYNFMGMAHHKEVQRNCGEFLHAHHLTAEGSGVLVLGLGNRVVCLQDQVDRKASTLDSAKLNHLVQQLAEHLHIGVASVTHGFLRDEYAGAPPMCHSTSDCHPRPRLQALNLMGFPVEAELRPHCLFAVHGIYNDHQDSRIETPRREAKVPI